MENKDKEKELEKENNTCECEDCNCENEACECGDDHECENCDCEHDHECGDDCECNHEEEHVHDENCNHEHTHEHDPRYEYILSLEKDLKEAEDKVIRVKADMINYRKRVEEEQLKMFKYMNEDIIKNILPIVDNFERAIALDDSNLDDELSKFLTGFKMVYDELSKVLIKYEVKEIEALNKEFDSNYHEAVATEKVEGLEAGKVTTVLQKGYILKDKVIRPSMVKVSE